MSNLVLKGKIPSSMSLFGKGLCYYHTHTYRKTINNGKIDDIHRELKCYAFEDDLQEYAKLKQKFEEKKARKKKNANKKQYQSFVLMTNTYRF